MSEDRDKYAGTHLGAGFCFPTFKSVMVEFKMPDFELFTYFNRMRAASETHVFFLESRTEKSDARYSLLGCRPLLVMEDRQGRVEVTGESLDYQSIDSDIFSMQRAFLDSQKVGTGVRDQGFFPGGLVGYWGYDQALRSPDIGYRSREVSLPPADQPYGSGAGGRDSRAARFPESACFFPGLVVVQDRRTSIVRVYGFTGGRRRSGGSETGKRYGGGHKRFGSITRPHSETDTCAGYWRWFCQQHWPI